MLNKPVKFISAVFAIIWMVIIFTEFWHYDPSYSKSLQFFQYYDFLIFIGVLGAGIMWFIKKRKDRPLKNLNGLSIFLALLILNSISIILFYGKLNGLNLNVSGLFSQLGFFIGISICVLLVYIVIRLLGSLFTTIFSLQISNLDLPIIQAAIGIALLTFLSFFLGLIGLLNGFVLIPLCLLVVIFYWRHALQILKNTLIKSIKIPKDLNAIGVFSFLFLALFLVFNFVQILRPFPIGSDSLNLYVNIPVLLAENGSLVHGYQPYNWSLFMSIGMIVFGKIEVVLGLSFLGGLLSLFALFQLSRKWLDVNYSALGLLLFYSTPMISFFSYMDMKVDMGLLFITLSILLIYYNWVNPTKSTKDIIALKGIGLSNAKKFFGKHIPTVLKQNRLFILIGFLTGFAFGIKLTVLFFFLALNCAIWFVKGGKLTFITSFFLCLGLVFLLKLDAQSGLRQFHQYVTEIQWGLLAIGFSLTIYLFIKKKGVLRELVTYSLIMASFFALSILPWIGKNFSETKQLTVSALLNGKKASPIFNIKNSTNKSETNEVVIPGIYQLPEKSNAIEKQRNNDLNKSISEDLHRFMGYEILPARYLSLPYDVFIKTNISKHFTDIGFILLLLFPILFLFPSRQNIEWKAILSKLTFILLCLLLLVVSIPGAFLNQNNLTNPMDGISILNARNSSGFLDSFSDMTNMFLLDLYAPINDWFSTIYISKDPVTYPILLVLFLLILSLIFVRIKKHSKVSQSIIIFLVVYFFLWWILGAGVAWYGMLIFTLPYIFLLKGIESNHDEIDHENRPSYLSFSVKKIVVLSVSVIWILLAFMNRTTNYNPIDNERAKHIFYPSLLEYQVGNLNKQKLTDYHFPNIRKLTEIINRNKRSLVYRVGTPASFFIEKNDRRVLGDNYLNLFDKLVNQYQNKEKIIDVLKSKGFKYIIFDLNVVGYDETPDKTLSRKFIQFMNTLYANPKVELIATDRQIKLNNSEQVIFAVFQDQGTIVKSGTIALFEIK